MFELLITVAATCVVGALLGAGLRLWGRDILRGVVAVWDRMMLWAGLSRPEPVVEVPSRYRVADDLSRSLLDVIQAAEADADPKPATGPKPTGPASYIRTGVSSVNETRLREGLRPGTRPVLLAAGVEHHRLVDPPPPPQLCPRCEWEKVTISAVGGIVREVYQLIQRCPSCTAATVVVPRDNPRREGEWR